MRTPAVLAGLATSTTAAILAAAAATMIVAVALAATPPAGDAPRVDAPIRPAAVAPHDHDALSLGRAVAEWRAGNLRGVVENLEAIDFAAGPSFAEADRAAFLLGQAYRRLGMNSRWEALARAVAGWKLESSYTKWLTYQFELLEAEAAPALAGGVAPDRSPLAIYRRALALEASGAEADAEWARLAAHTATALERDLAGASLIRRATRALGRGEDARALLEAVPAGSKFASRARHILGLTAFERGDLEEGERILESLLADSAYAARREVRLALAGRALERASWAIALGGYEHTDLDWARHRDALDDVLARGSFDAVWASWEADAMLSDALMLDASAIHARAESLATVTVDLTMRPDAEVPALEVPPNSPSLAWPIAPPSAAEWAAVAHASHQLDEARAGLTRAQWELAGERERLEELRRYLGTGLERAQREAAELATRSALLDSIRRTLDALDARLRSVRDTATRRVLERTASIVEQCMNDLLWIRGMRHFHIDGPHRGRASAAPPGVPEPDSVLFEEEALARAILAAAQRLATDAPDLIARSYERAWRPGLIDRARRQADDAARALAWAHRLAGSVDSSIAANATSPGLRHLAARVVTLERSVDSLRTAHRDLRATVARAAVGRARAALDGEREAIDYGLAAASYGLGVQLAAPAMPEYVAPARALVRDSTAAHDTNEELDDPAVVAWREQAITSVRGFLERHPGSFARGEMRFRLADLLLVDARHEFHERMASYTQAQAEHRAPGPLPILSHREALEIYRAILKEDPAFEHRDAVQFNAAMILADQGEPEAERLFGELVREHPGSVYCQEAYLRMGDMRFAAKRLGESITFYEHAARGPDPGLTAIALYKTGWAHYDENRYREAADAFRSVLDLYASQPHAAHQADLADEAETYLVHALAGAGGARAFAEHFDRVGPRPYETRVLLALGQNFRRLGLHADASAADERFIERYPRHADALLGAQRLIESRRRASPGAPVTAARLAYAPRFAPGSAWYEEQTSDSVRTAASEFARASWMAAAREHHRAARERDSRDDWQLALDTYQILLTRWPNDPGTATLALSAGEAAAALGDHPLAMQHFGAAAVGRDSVARSALWQRVAVADAWYASTREKPRSGAEAPGGAVLGRDSLARTVLGAADELLERFPEHPKAAELAWRQGSLAFAHGWYERAAQDFGRLAERHPADRRAVQAACLRADALYRLQDYAAAAGAYESALVAARRAGVDSLARRAATAIPVCYFRHAEAAVAADSTRHEQHAELFEKIAARWPEYEHAHLAQYRAGLSFLAAGKTPDAVRAMEAVIANFPRSPYMRDAHLQIAQAWKHAGERERSAEAYARFAARYRDDESARDAWLEAADLFATAGLAVRAENQRLAYLGAFPADAETAMEILEPLARRDLQSVGSGRPIAALLPAPRAARGKTAAARAPRPSSNAGTSHLAEYLKRAEANPRLASSSLLAQVRFLEAEEAFAAYAAMRLSVPLAKSIAAKHRHLDQTLALYRRSVDLGATEWAHASAYRMGEMLVTFGDALERSERPADLQGDDLRAYEEVLAEKSQPYHDRGEGVWRDMLKQQAREAVRDTWIEKAEAALWQRLGGRFFFRPEAEFPLVAASPPVLGELVAASDSLAAAEAALVISIERDSSNAPTLMLLSKLYFESRRHAEAVTLLEAVRARGSVPDEMLAGLALHYDALDQPDRARAIMSALPESRATRSARVYVALRGDTPDEAGRDASAAVGDDPKNAVHQNNYGIAKLRSGDVASARRALLAAIDLNPALAGPYYNLTILEKYYVFDDQAAQRWFEAYWERAHDDPDSLQPVLSQHEPDELAKRGGTR